MYSHQSSVILVDEPDAHLEIIKQRTIYALLNDVAAQNHIQLVIATHSEVVLNDAVDNSIAMILDGEAKVISNKDKEVKPVLRDYGVEHFFKASITKNILYVEGSTDISIIKAFAQLLGEQKVVDILEGELNYYYVQNPCHEDNIENIVDRAEGYYKSKFSGHFSAIKRIIPEFTGIGIIDSDGNQNDNNYPEGLTVHKWSKYELENYFIFPYVLDHFFEIYLGGVDNIYYQFYLNAKKKITTDFLFDGNEQSYNIYDTTPEDAKALLWATTTHNKKMSKFVDSIMDEYVALSNSSYPLRKGEYYRLIQYMNIVDVDQEIKDVLQLIEQNL